MAPGRMTTVTNGDFLPSRMPSAGAQSLPATPSSTNVRTFTDYSGEHTRLTTLHGSTGALEVNNLGGFTTSMANGNKLANALESSIDGIVRTTTTVSGPMNGMAPIGEFNSGLNSHMGVVGRNGNGVDHLGLGMGHGNLHNKSSSTNSGMASGIPVHILTSVSSGTGIGNGNGMGGQFHSGMLQTQHSQPAEVIVNDNEVDDMSDVFTGLSFKEPSLGAAPGYGRSRLRRSSAPVGNGDQGAFGPVGSGQNGYGLWGNSAAGNNGESEFPIGAVTEGVAMTGMNQVGREYGLMPPMSRNSPVPQQQQQQQHQQHQHQQHLIQHHQQQHHHNSQFSSTGGTVGGASGSFSAGIGPHASFKTAWTTVNPSQGVNPPQMRLPLGMPGMGGAPVGVDNSSAAGMTSQHGGTQSIWSQGSFHSNTGIGMSSVPSSGLPNNSAPATANGTSSSKPASNSSNLPSTSISGSNNNSGNQPNGNPPSTVVTTSRPNSQTSSYSGSESSLSGISPIYSPTNNTTGFTGFSSNGNGSGNQSSNSSDINYPPSTLGLGLFPAGPLGMLSGGGPGGGEERESRSPFRVSVYIVMVARFLQLGLSWVWENELEAENKYGNC